MRPRHQRGIALITAIVLVAVATVIATAIAFSSAMAARRATTVFGADQSLLAAEGAEAVAAYLLQQSLGSGSGTKGGQSSSSSGGSSSSSGGSGSTSTSSAANGATTTQSTANSQVTALNQMWAQAYGPTELLPGVTLESFQLEDQQGKFNINNLAPGPSGATDPIAVQQFGVLLSLLQIDTKWAYIIADWIDSDIEPNVPYGAEDSVYLAQNPQYRAANEPVSSISELLATGMGRDIYDRIAPYITALPSGPGSAINVCTASGLLLDSISGSIEYSTDVDLASERRVQGCHPTLQEFQASLNPQTSAQLVGRLGQQSSYFRLICFITIGTARFRLYSLLQRDLSGQVRVVLRTFGTE